MALDEVGVGEDEDSVVGVALPHAEAFAAGQFGVVSPRPGVVLGRVVVGHPGPPSQAVHPCPPLSGIRVGAAVVGRRRSFPIHVDTAVVRPGTRERPLGSPKDCLVGGVVDAVGGRRRTTAVVGHGDPVGNDGGAG